MPKKRNQNNDLKREFDKGRKTISMHCSIDKYNDLIDLKERSGRTWLDNLRIGLEAPSTAKSCKSCNKSFTGIYNFCEPCIKIVSDYWAEREAARKGK